MTKRKVIRGGDKSYKARAGRFFTAFTSPSNFKRYWFNADGAKRAGKIVAVGFGAVLLVFLYFAKDLPSPGKINARIGSQNTVFYDRTGTHKLYEVHGDKNRRVIEFSDMPVTIKNATIAVEDKDFYRHGAFSFVGIIRSAVVDVVNRGTYQGGSTITQQYVKNALLDPSDRSITRKIKELILSIEIESLYKKDDILKLYLNEIPYGSQAYGIESACRTYFPADVKNDKCAPNLTLAQASTLASMANAPSYYSPYGPNTDDLAARQNTVIDKMVTQKMISSDEAKASKITAAGFATQLSLAPVPQTQTAASQYPHFAQYAQDFLEDKYGTNLVENGGLKVITTLDIDKQDKAQASIDKNMKTVRSLGGSNVAMVSADPKSGQVLAMIGSYNASDPKFGAFNVARAGRQPGSSFKPFAYATALGNTTNWGPGSTIYDVQTDFGGGYKPKNFTNRFYGVQSVRTALDGSLNIPAVKMLYIAGVADTIKTAHNLGITTLNNGASNYGLSLVLGSGEVKLNDMVNAYESFANGGVHYEPTPILKVTDPNNRVIVDNSKPPAPKKVLDPQVAYLMANVLSDDKSRQYIFGANNPLHINGRNVAAKTGTTENYNDAWTMGFSPDLVTGVWAGNNDNKPMSSEAADIAAPIWHDYMTKALEAYPASSNWTAPSGIKTVTLDTNTGKLPGPNTKATRTDIFPSWYKPENVASAKTANIDKISNKLATECTPPAALQSVTSSDIHAEIPSNDPAYVRWDAPIQALAKTLGYAGGGSIPTDTDDVHKCSDTKPTVSVSTTGSGPLNITASVSSGTFTANSLTIYFDDQVVSTQTINGDTNYTFVYSPTTTGSHTVKAVVSDSGLYSGSGEKTVNVLTAGSGGSGGSPLP
jgi:membrane peptidoglycan carboxypeptidase